MINLKKKLLNKWKSFSKGQKITVVIFGLIFIFALISITYAFFGPKLTQFYLTYPVSLGPSEKHTEYPVDNSTKQIQIKGVTEAGANVKAYVIYDSNSAKDYNVTEFIKYSSDFDPETISNAKSVGKQFNAEVNQNGDFTFSNIPIIPSNFGKTWIFITANINGKEENVKKIIIIHNPAQTAQEDENQYLKITNWTYRPWALV